MAMAVEEDRLSKLPDEVILHILSFLPTEDVVRTCLLSKHWKLMWYSVPTLSFSDADGIDSDIEKLYEYVDNYLKHRKTSKIFMVDSTITSFKLQMMNSYQIYKDACIDKWLAFAVENKVKEISVCLNSCCLRNRLYGHYTYHVRYRLPKSIVNARDLTILKLNGLALDISCSMGFPALKTLSLKDVSIENHNKDDHTLFKLLSGCSSLEKLCLRSCSNLNLGVLCSQSLKCLKIRNVDLLSFEVEATNLETLIVDWLIFKNSFSACKTIRNLTLCFSCFSCCDEDSSSSIKYQILSLLENWTLKQLSLETPAALVKLGLPVRESDLKDVDFSFFRNIIY
ncbi:F-box/FBD/LRR-repeat protein At5g56420-like [Humulus lupulus]|uniref:F-box/FBD/LRR-repeat protein At5g56420-like n=1 Tax=Humulus lupulus TaxID=3486 RepID=UPI002B4150BD|nr:F-box/FBD/LRR-repeat protein At5g56420-like [Humulus lupulus]